MEKYDIMEKSHSGCHAGKQYLTDLPEFSKGGNKHVDVARLLDKVGVDFQQGFTISVTKGS